MLRWLLRNPTPKPEKLELWFQNPKYESYRVNTCMSFPHNPVVQSSGPVHWSSPLFSDSHVLVYFVATLIGKVYFVASLLNAFGVCMYKLLARNIV